MAILTSLIADSRDCYRVSLIEYRFRNYLEISTRVGRKNSLEGGVHGCYIPSSRPRATVQVGRETIYLGVKHGSQGLEIDF